jgi:hypothetical protein
MRFTDSQPRPVMGWHRVGQCAVAIKQERIEVLIAPEIHQRSVSHWKEFRRLRTTQKKQSIEQKKNTLTDRLFTMVKLQELRCRTEMLCEDTKDAQFF